MIRRFVYGLLLFSVLCLTGCLDTPDEVLYKFQTYVAYKDWDNLWKLLSREDRDFFETIRVRFITLYELEPESLESFVEDVKNFENMDAKATFGLLMEKTYPANTKKRALDVVSVSVYGDRAVVCVKNTYDGFAFKREYGVWKVSLDELRNCK